MYSREEQEYQRSCDKKAMEDDLFQEFDAPVANYGESYREIPRVLPDWLDETRLICFVVGFLGLIFTIFNIGYLARTISNPFLLNLSILIGLAGFSNFMLFPNLLKYNLVNGLRRSSILRSLSSFMIGFSILLLVFLFSFPIYGLGLALILVPAPMFFSLFSRGLIDHRKEREGEYRHIVEIFDRDFRRLAWFSFSLIFCALIIAFFGLLFGLI